MWTPGQLRAFLDTARQHRLFAFYRLAAYAGARRGELLHLRLARHRPGRPRGPHHRLGRRHHGTPHRGNDQERPVPDRQHRRRPAQVLTDHRKRQAADRLKGRPKWRGTDDYVFATAWGEPIHPDTGSSLMTVEASEMVSIPRAELDALKAELRRLRREVGRGWPGRVSALIPVRAMTRPRSREGSLLKPGN